MKLQALPLLAAVALGALSLLLPVSSLQMRRKPFYNSQQTFINQEDDRRLQDSADSENTAAVYAQLQPPATNETAGERVINVADEHQNESLVQLFGTSKYVKKLKEEYKELKKRYKKLHSSNDYKKFKYETMITALQRALGLPVTHRTRL
ncbi:uncharacterized protein EMH_0062570 [Eimeria mitis]|uniref:Uncharacterized protein n=1 Tax=Eimeria mitis TaxID=44415 RepID=U6K8U9_9EIME|nr:uncharacterized protein EMH_0062570 [Eimeria mitis]CDJ34445.1 hypothetical protein, conserved [Eimeria mitis]